MNDVTTILRSKGLKVTPQRIAIFSMLNSTKEHPSADVIYKSLAEDNPAMSLATVYKTLDSFQSANLVQLLNVGEGSSRYDAEMKEHPHLVCKCCGNVTDFDNASFENLRSEAQDHTDFEISSEQLFFFGICKACQEN